ncbi:MAG: hypothetical protein ACTHJQ_19095 [Rhizobiaceae bacterium]|jgi:hypothetical protein
MNAEARGFVQAWLDVNLPRNGGDPARLARRCRAAAKEAGIDIDSLEPEWGVSLKDIIHEALQHRDEAGRRE